MGTSTGWRGPRWGDLLGTPRRSTRPEQIPAPRDGDTAGPDPAWVGRQGQILLDRLWRDLRADPEAYGLRSRMTVMGRELVPAVVRIAERDTGPPDLVRVGEFTTLVAGTGTSVVAAVGRRAAVRAGERLLSARGDAAFCVVYRQFFAEVVAEFLKAVIAEEIKVAMPALMLIDPAGEIADWVAGRLVALVPDPCAALVPGRTVLQVAVERVPAAVDVVLGLRESA